MGLHMMDLPLICPRRLELEQLLNKSLEMERIIMVPGAHEEEEKDHQQTFWRLAFNEDMAFCRVDTVRLFRYKTSWEQVVEHLQRLAGKRSFGTFE